MHDEKTPLVACPECGSHRVGKLGGNQYYCGDCCVELLVHPARGRIDVFDIDEEGNLTAAGTHPVPVKPRRRDAPPPVH